MGIETGALLIFALLPMVLAVAFRQHLRRARARSPDGRARAAALIVGNALMLAFLASVALLVGECWLRFAYDSTDTFGLLRTTDRWFERHWHRNAESFRDDVDYDLGAVPEGRRRVTFIGDSFTTGHGVPDVEARFANLIRAARPDLDIQVLAVNGWDTGQQLNLLANDLPPYTHGQYGTDLFVLVYCLNDICDLDPGIKPLGRELWEARQRGLLTRSSYAFDTLRFLWLISGNEDVRDYFPHLSGLYAGDVWANQRRRLTALATAGGAYGAELAVVTFPMIHQLDEEYPLRDAHASLAAHWEHAGIPHLDLLPTFAGRDADDLVVGAFDAHPNERAHALAAAAILPFLDGLVPPR